MPATLGQRLRALRNEVELSQEDLAKSLHISQSSIAYYELGRKHPGPDTLMKIASFFDVTTDYLLGLTDNLHHRTIDPPLAQPVGATVQVPIIGVIRAGEPLLAEQHIEDWEEVPRDWLNGSECFFLRVTGDSMTGARIQEGDLVFVRRQEAAENGDIVVAMVNSEDATIKRIFYADDTTILHPENPRYKPLVFHGKEQDNIRIVGKVLWFRGVV